MARPPTPTASAPARPSSTPRSSCSPTRAISAPACATWRRAVGVRESALYNYFTSKEALFDALIARRSAQQERAAGVARRRGPIADGRALLEQLAVVSLESFLDAARAEVVSHPDVRRHPAGQTGRINLLERMGSGRERLQELMRRLIATAGCATATRRC